MFEMGIMDFIDKEEVLRARALAVAKMKECETTMMIGYLYGGEVFITVKFDYSKIKENYEANKN